LTNQNQPPLATRRRDHGLRRCGWEFETRKNFDNRDSSRRSSQHLATSLLAAFLKMSLLPVPVSYSQTLKFGGSAQLCVPVQYPASAICLIFIGTEVCNTFRHSAYGDSRAACRCCQSCSRTKAPGTPERQKSCLSLAKAARFESGCCMYDIIQSTMPPKIGHNRFMR
jgi:hypothetical protein